MDKDILNPRQEAFALHVAMGESLSEAYRQAGFVAKGNALHVAATKLAQKGKVRLRIDQIVEQRQRAMVATATWDAKKISSMLAEAFDDAKKWKQTGAQVAAAMGLAKLHGLLVDKTEDVTRRATRNPDAPIEIDVDHWVNEQVALLQPPQAVASPASDPAPAGHGAPLLEPDLLEPRSPDVVQTGQVGPDLPNVPNVSAPDADAGEARSPQGSKGSRALN